VTSDHEKVPVVPVGFAGLASLVSDIDALVSAVTRSASRQTREARTSGSTAAAVHRSESRGNDQGVRDYDPATVPVRRAWRFRWMIGAVAALIVSWLIASTSDPTTTPTVTTSSPSASQPVYEPLPSQAGSVSEFTRPSSSQSSLAQQPNASDGSEQVPPIGSDHVLDAEQIRYCLSEDIRLEAARDVVSADAEVSRFNSMVEDFNSRCANYQYRRQVFDAVKRQVEANRSLLELEGIVRFGR
jgi:hypothetical protein